MRLNMPLYSPQVPERKGKLATIKPERNASVYVRVGKKEFPVKQAFAEATGLIRSQFSTKDAVRVLEWVGFTPKDKKRKEE